MNIIPFPFQNIIQLYGFHLVWFFSHIEFDSGQLLVNVFLQRGNAVPLVPRLACAAISRDSTDVATATI